MKKRFCILGLAVLLICLCVSALPASAEESCPHDHTDSWSYLTEPTAYKKINNNYHWVWGTRATETYCTDCYQTLDIKKTTPAVEFAVHYYDENGLCPCGYKKPCNHEHTVGSVWSWGGMYYENCGAEGHRAVYTDAEVHYICEDCGVEIGEPEMVAEYKNEYIWEHNMVDGVCTDCGYTAPKKVTLKFSYDNVTYYLAHGEKGRTPNANYLLKKGRYAAGLRWSSSNTKVISIDKKTGMMELLKPGTATITVKCGTKKATIKVTVAEPVVKSLKVSKKTLSLKVGKKYAVGTYISDYSAMGTKLKFTSSNKKVATVNGSGVITAKKAGTCKITVTTTDKSKKSVTITVTVKK